MSRSAFWVGVAVGAAGGTAATLLANGLSTHQNRMLRFERSVKIGCPSAEVFAACARLERMPELIRWVVSVASGQDVSLWIADIEGHRYEWDVEIVQVIPNQVIGWKSHGSPKHSGTISFLSAGSETLVQVDMNCEPRQSMLARLLDGEIRWDLGDALEAALHDLKTSLESKRQRRAEAVPHPLPKAPAERATGTYGPQRQLTQEERVGWNGDEEFEEPIDDDYL